jgi:hypothetical protein
MRWIIFAAAVAVTLSGAAAGQARSGQSHSAQYRASRYRSGEYHFGGYHSGGHHSAPARSVSACAQGELTRIRVSKIKPGGSIAGFRDAVAAHSRWYKAHGYHIEQRIAPAVQFSRGKARAASQEVMTFATSDDVPREKHDAAWDAFVAKYRANSEIERETIVCMSRS